MDTLADNIVNSMARLKSLERPPGSDGFTRATLICTPRSGEKLTISPWVAARTVRIVPNFTLADRERSHEFLKAVRNTYDGGNAIVAKGLSAGDSLWVAGFEKAVMGNVKKYNQSDYMRRAFSGYLIEFKADASEPSFTNINDSGAWFNVFTMCNKIFNCNTLEIARRTSTNPSDVWGNGSISLERVFPWANQGYLANMEFPIGYGEGTLSIGGVGKSDIDEAITRLIKENDRGYKIVKCGYKHASYRITTPQNGRYYSAAYTTIGLKFAKDFERTAISSGGECGYTKKTLIANTMVELLCCVVVSSELTSGIIQNGDPFQLWIMTRGKRLYI